MEGVQRRSLRERLPGSQGLGFHPYHEYTRTRVKIQGNGQQILGYEICKFGDTKYYVSTAARPLAMVREQRSAKWGDDGSDTANEPRLRPRFRCVGRDHAGRLCPPSLCVAPFLRDGLTLFSDSQELTTTFAVSMSRADLLQDRTRTHRRSRQSPNSWRGRAGPQTPYCDFSQVP